MKEKRKIHFRRNLKEYFHFINKHKFLFYITILSVILTEALFVADKFLYKWFIDDAELFFDGALELSKFSHTILIIFLIFVGVVIFRSVGKYMNTFLVCVLEPKIAKDLKEKYFNHIIRLSHKFHSSHKSGKLISKLNRGSAAIENLTDSLIYNISPLILQIILVSTSLAFFSKEAALMISIISITFISYSIFIQKIQNKAKLKWNKSLDEESGFISDSLTNIETVKYLGKEKKMNSNFKKMTEKTRKNSFKYYNTFSYLDFGQTMILGIGTILLLWFPIKQFTSGAISLSTIVFIYSLYGNIAGNLFSFTSGIRGFNRAMSDMEDLFEYGKIKNDVKDRPNAKNFKVKSGSVEFENVDFGFEEKNGIFKNFNLKIKPNEKIALVGHSGSGKTTVVKLLNRLYDVDSGAIKIDGKNIKDFKQESIRNETGIVPQEPILFDDTIYNNIKFARPSAKKDEIMRAIKLAQLEKIIDRLPKRENTIVGERGIKLSGGEKQRVSIARAILANKKILVLDEATSALDSQTEHDIQKALKILLKGRTSIIIAHRLSTIMNSDRIIVLKKGKIVEAGNHKELIKKNGEYSKLWNLQSGGYLQE